MGKRLKMPINGYETERPSANTSSIHFQMLKVRFIVGWVCACIWLNKTFWWVWGLVSGVINQGASTYPWSPNKRNHYKKPLLQKWLKDMYQWATRHQLFLVRGPCPQSCSVRWRSRVLLMGSGRLHSLDEVIMLAVKVWAWIRQGCFNAHVCAVSCTDGVRKTSNRIKSPLDCDLFFSWMWKHYVLCGN